jgi:hypothetical protein
MPRKRNNLSDDDIAKIQTVINKVGSQYVNTLNRTRVHEQDPPASDIFVALAPIGGIPALQGFGDPGTALCQVYQVVQDTQLGTSSGTMTGSNLQVVDTITPQLVNNLAPSSIQENVWVLVVRDRFGQWFVAASFGSTVDNGFALVTSATTYPAGFGTNSAPYYYSGLATAFDVNVGAEMPIGQPLWVVGPNHETLCRTVIYEAQIRGTNPADGLPIKVTQQNCCPCTPDETGTGTGTSVGGCPNNPETLYACAIVEWYGPPVHTQDGVTYDYTPKSPIAESFLMTYGNWFPCDDGSFQLGWAGSFNVVVPGGLGTWTFTTYIFCRVDTDSTWFSVTNLSWNLDIDTAECGQCNDPDPAQDITVTLDPFYTQYSGVLGSGPLLPCFFFTGTYTFSFSVAISQYPIPNCEVTGSGTGTGSEHGSGTGTFLPPCSSGIRDTCCGCLPATVCVTFNTDEQTTPYVGWNGFTITMTAETGLEGGLYVGFLSANFTDPNTGNTLQMEVICVNGAYRGIMYDHTFNRWAELSGSQVNYPVQCDPFQLILFADGGDGGTSWPALIGLEATTTAGECPGTGTGTGTGSGTGSGSGSGGGGGSQTFSYTGSTQTFTVPSGVTSITIHSVGGGASGNSGVSIGGTGFTGGAGGYYAAASLTVSPGDTITVNVGVGGVVGMFGETAGGDSWASNTGAAPSSTSQGCLAPGGLSITSVVATTYLAGGSSPSPLFGNGGGAGGGGTGAAVANNGTNSSGSTGGAGGTGDIGNGGNGGNSGSAGSNGSGIGAGGGGGGFGGTSGNGANGQVVITWA